MSFSLNSYRAARHGESGQSTQDLSQRVFEQLGADSLRLSWRCRWRRDGRGDSIRAMTPFRQILETAERRHGGARALAALLPEPKTAPELKAVPDHRYLSDMSRRVFQAGLRHSMVDAKWPAFEEVFHGFVPRRVAAMHDEEIEALLADKRLIRHPGKLRSVPRNAAAMVQIAAEKGGFGAYLADWPADDPVGLWDDLGRRFTQVGGNSGPYFLRMCGKDTFILTQDVVKALNASGAFDGTPKGKGDRRKVQEAFNAWAKESGRPLCQISRVLALSVG